MPSLLIYAATALITYIAYVQLHALVRTYSKNNEPFMAGGHYVLPPSVFAAIRKVPDSIANSTPANEDGLVLEPFLGHDNTDIIHLVRTTLNQLRDEEWYPLTVHPSTLTAIGRITTRILVGSKYTTLPARHRHLGRVRKRAPLFNTTRRVAKLRALILPDVRELLANPPTPGTYPDGEPTVLPMMVNYVLSRPGYAEAKESEVLTGVIGRLLDFSFAAVDTTTITLTHCIHDLVSHPPSLYASPILEQARAVLAANDGVWTTQALSALPLLDSFIKESQRLHPIGQLLSQRKVLDPKGVVLMPSEGFEGAKPVYLPYGAVTQMPLLGVHMDGGFYEDAREFRGFRFAEDKVARSQPSDRFMSFGHEL
ncbi:hypothetical protein VE04_08542 [Pseudogymnoascus sp. 24MN13]|nr:hypothetical protein VE04_08542 [Pseudogymnoascus sp. 24MN13]